MDLDRLALEWYARGCGVLHAGGAGDVDLGLVIASSAIETHGPVRLLGADELDDDALVMPCGMIGSPTVALERIWNGDEGDDLVASIEREWGRTVSVVMCYEVAGVNGLLPVAWAARLGLPLLDADGMGRAFPEMQQQTMNLAGISASPMVLTDGRGNAVVIRAINNLWAERLARNGNATFGASAAALYTMSGRDARHASIAGSVSRAIAIGEAMERPAGERVDAVAEIVGGEIVLDGRIIAVEREASERFVEGAITLEGHGRHAGRLIRLEFQNEIMLAIEEGSIVASVPDLISVFDEDTGEPLFTETFRNGQRARVLVHPAPAVWKTPAGLELVGPLAFGYRQPASSLDR